MARGDKSAYTDKQKRQARHIEVSYEKRGVAAGEAQRRAWATENKLSGGGKNQVRGVSEKPDLQNETRVCAPKKA